MCALMQQLLKATHVLTQVWEAAEDVRPLFAEIDRMVHTNIKRVQQVGAAWVQRPAAFCRGACQRGNGLCRHQVCAAGRG